MTDLFTRIRVIDFETTGFPPGAKIVEVGYTDVTLAADGWYVENKTWSSLVNPGIKIPPAAMAIHNITDEMVADAPTSDAVLPKVFSGADYYAAHNVEFDRKFAPSKVTNWICTLKASRAVWPDFEKHTNQFLRYKLGLAIDPKQAEPAHRAGADTLVTAHLLMALLNERPLPELLKVSSGKSLPLTIPFGKHRGKRFSELPLDYLHWITGSNLSSDIKSAARKAIEVRAAA